MASPVLVDHPCPSKPCDHMSELFSLCPSLFLEVAVSEDSLDGVGQMCGLFMSSTNDGYLLLCVTFCPGPVGQGETKSLAERKGWDWQHQSVDGCQ